MRRVYVRLDKADIDRLVRLAQQHRRHPADEAALLLTEVLRDAEGRQEQIAEGVA